MSDSQIVRFPQLLSFEIEIFRFRTVKNFSHGLGLEVEFPKMSEKILEGQNIYIIFWSENIVYNCFS